MVKKIITGEFLTNTYLLITGKKCILIDPGLNFDRFTQTIKDEYEVVAILITHGHLDHMDGMAFFDVPIYYPLLDESFLNDKRLSLYQQFYKKPSFIKDKLNLIFVTDGMEFNLLDYHFKVIHTPGHTVGSVCYLCQEGLFCGDTLFRLSAGRTDFPTGNIEMLQSSLKKLRSLVPLKTKVYPGHQEETTLEKECDENPFFRI